MGLILLFLSIGSAYYIARLEPVARTPSKPSVPTAPLAPFAPLTMSLEANGGAECAILLHTLPASILALMDQASISENSDVAMMGVASIMEENFPKQARCLRDLVKSSGGGPGPIGLPYDECNEKLSFLDQEFVDMIDLASRSSINPMLEMGKVADILELRGLEIEATCLRNRMKKIAGPPASSNSVCDAYLNDVPDGDPIFLRTKLRSALANPLVTNTDLESFAYIVDTIGYKETAICIRARVKERNMAGESTSTSTCSFLELPNSGSIPALLSNLPPILASVPPAFLTPRSVATAYYQQSRLPAQFNALASALEALGAPMAAGCVRERGKVIETAYPVGW